jgi:hypothetical protein
MVGLARRGHLAVYTVRLVHPTRVIVQQKESSILQLCIEHCCNILIVISAFEYCFEEDFFYLMVVEGNRLRLSKPIHTPPVHGSSQHIYLYIQLVRIKA